MTMVDTEQQLASLLQAGAEPNNTKWAREWKKRGGKVIGLLCSYVPEEVIHAAGMLPYHITGTLHGQPKESLLYWPSNVEQYYAHALESLLTGGLDFLDGVVCTDSTDASRRCLDVWRHIGKTPYCYMLHVPYRRAEVVNQEFAGEVASFRDSLQSHFSARIADDALLASIRLHNRMRAEMAKVYDVRKLETPPLSGAEFLGLTTAALVMPKETFLKELAEVFRYLAQRKTSLPVVTPRLMVSSDRLFHPGYLEAIESQGALVAMDDLDTGSRYFEQLGDTDSDPIESLARRYMGRPGTPRMEDWDRQIDRMIALAREYRIDGIINLPQEFDYPRHFASPYFRQRLQQEGIPVFMVSRDHIPAHIGPLRTRVGAFIEMIEAGDNKSFGGRA